MLKSFYLSRFAVDDYDFRVDGLRPEQENMLNKLFHGLFNEGKRHLLIEAQTGIGKTRIALEFIRGFWRMCGKCSVLIVVPRRALIHNPWRKEIEKWFGEAVSELRYLTGDMHPIEREKCLSSFREGILIMTAGALNNDYILGRVNLDLFRIIVFDEAHYVVALGEEAGQYRYSIHYRKIALKLVTSQDTVVLGLTIPGSERTVETEKHLKAHGVTSENALAPPTRTYVVKIDSAYARKLDLWFAARIARNAKILKKILGKKIPWKISEERLLDILEEKGIPREDYGIYLSALRNYYTLFQIRQDVWEGVYGRAIKKLTKNMEKLCGDEAAYKELELLIRNAVLEKRFTVANIVNYFVKQGKKVMVYAKFRLSALALQKTLWDYFDFLPETFMGGDPSSKLVDLQKNAQVVIFTPVAKEGLDLPEFDVLVHLSAHSDEFTRRQIRGRIRGGEEYYVVFKDTNDERKLDMDIPEPEGPLELRGGETIKLPIQRVDKAVYRVILEPSELSPYLSIPVSLYNQLKHRNMMANAIGALGEYVTAYHYELTGRAVHKLSLSLTRRKRLTGLNKRQISFIKNLCYTVSNPPFDLVAVGNPTLLIEVKTITKPSKNPKIEYSKAYHQLLEKARQLNLIPTLVTVNMQIKENEVVGELNRRSLI